MLSPSSVLVTGTNRGIGLELIKQLSQLKPAPKHIFATCRNPGDAKELQALSKDAQNITIVQLDATDVASMEAAKDAVEKKLGGEGLNLLINNAGVAIWDTIGNIKADDMMKTYHVNAVGPVMMSQTFLPLLKLAASKAPTDPMSCSRAAIINISTGVASIGENDTGRSYGYRCSKAALNMATKSLSLDLKDDGILVTAIHPGWVKTDLGTAKATMETSESVGRLINLMGKCTTGQFLHHSGREMAW